MATLNYEDKVAINVNPNIPEKNKVTDGNMNLIKQVGNQILTTMGVYTDNWSSSATYNVDETAIYDNRIFKNLTGTNTATTPDQDTTNWEETTLASMSGGGGGGVTGDTLPIGSIVPYGSTTAPTNWLVCDGSAVSRTTYADLFAVIGTSFGAGNGSTTFNLPNLKGKVPVGYNSSETEFDTMGETGGEKTHTLTTDEIPSSVGLLNKIDNTYPGAVLSATSGWKYNANREINASYGQPHNNLQPYQTVNYIIKAKQSAGVVANVSNTQSNSQVDTYSCDYINNAKAPGINTPHETGYTTDQFGNLKHKADSTQNNFQIKDYAGNVRFQYYYETGDIYINHEKQLVRKVLWTGDTTSTITDLAESVNNFSEIEVFFRTNDGVSVKGSAKATGGNGTTLDLQYIWCVGSTFYMKQANVELSGTSITFKNNIQWPLGDNISSGSYIYITKVVGYK